MFKNPVIAGFVLNQGNQGNIREFYFNKKYQGQIREKREKSSESGKNQGFFSFLTQGLEFTFAN